MFHELGLALQAVASRSANPAKSVRLIVCGGRDFNDNRMLSRVMWAVHERRHITEVIHTGQRGCAQMASRWAFEHAIKRTEMRAEWSRYGEKHAPVIRNRKMLELQPHGIVVFSESSDVRNLLEQARKGCVPVLEGAAYFQKLQVRYDVSVQKRVVKPILVAGGKNITPVVASI